MFCVFGYMVKRVFIMLVQLHENWFLVGVLVCIDCNVPNGAQFIFVDHISIQASPRFD